MKGMPFILPPSAFILSNAFLLFSPSDLRAPHDCPPTMRLKCLFLTGRWMQLQERR
jgi:hypothetical protein